MIFGLHAIHVIGGVVALMVMFTKAFLGSTKMYSSVPVEVAATYWHFVDILWIYLLIFFIVNRVELINRSRDYEMEFFNLEFYKYGDNSNSTSDKMVEWR